jgi:hypothetical protein
MVLNHEEQMEEAKTEVVAHEFQMVQCDSARKQMEEQQEAE